MHHEIIERLHSIKGFVFDMDGTLILGDRRNNNMTTLPGAVPFLEMLDRLRLPWVVLTNGTVRSPAEYVKILSDAGIPMKPDNMMTPSSVAADYFQRQGYRRIMVLGCEGVWRPLTDLGLEVVLSNQPDPGPVDAVYIGWYREFGFVDLEAAYRAVTAGAPLYTASDVPFFATAQGPAIGTSCAIAAALKPLTGKDAVVLGKPSPEAVRAAAHRLELAPEEMAVVGDDPQLEVPMALAAGAMGIFVHSGTGKENAFKHLPSDQQPHISVKNLADLNRIYQLGAA